MILPKKYFSSERVCSRHSTQEKVAQLSFAEKQVIEIVKAIAVDASLLIMDEPTAAVSENETKRLLPLFVP